MLYTVLLTCVGGELAPESIQSLTKSRKHHLRVLGTDANPEALGQYFVDGFYVVPPGDEVAYVDKMLELVVQEEVDLLIPTSDEEALTLSSNREEFARVNCQLACAAHETLRLVSDKVDCYSFLENKGVPIPLWRQASKEEELLEAIETLWANGTGVVLKPARSRGSRGVVVICDDAVESERNSRELSVSRMQFEKEVLSRWQPTKTLVMPKMAGPVYDLDVLAWQGQVVNSVPRRRVNSRLPNLGHVVVDNPLLSKIAERLARLLHLSWLVDCDLMFDAVEQPWLLEVNPRPSGSVAVSLRAGVPLLEDLVSLALGLEVSATQLPSDALVVPYSGLQLARRHSTN